jgi:NADPH-dependent 2,4-dienoyl-CoA reductase/sulfur reductase-like enzyme
LNTIKNIIVVGGNAAGPAAAAKAKRIAPNANVLMIETSDYISTGTCELPYVLSEEIKNYKDIIFYSESSFEQEKGVKVLLKHFAEKIDRKRKTLHVRNLTTEKPVEFNYDKLILATGSKAKTLPAIHSGFKNVFVFKTVNDLLNIRYYLEKNGVRKILVIGSSYIGIESAEAFNKLGYSVTILDKEPLPFPGADEELRRLIQDTLKNNKVEFLGNISELKFSRLEDKITGIKIDGWQIEFDLVIQAIGFEPNSEIAINSKLEVGQFNGIKVDQRMKTSDPNIFAAGDCAEVLNKITSQYEYMPLATFAHSMGHIAGENAAGGNVVAKSIVKNIAVKLFDKNLVIVGLNSLEAKKHNFNFQSVTAIAQNIVKVMPNSESIFGKILFEKNAKKVLGAAFYGSKEIVGYGDIVSSFIHNNLTPVELANINYNYTPPLSPFVNLLSVLGRKIEKEFK